MSNHIYSGGRGHSFGGHDDRTSSTYDKNNRNDRYRGRRKPRGGYSPYKAGRGRGRGMSMEDDVSMEDNVGTSSRFTRKFNPYSNDRNERGRRGGRGRGRGKGPRRPYGYGSSASSWFKIIVPHGSKVGKDFLFQEINSLINVPFVPLHYTEESGGGIHFYVRDRDTANAIRGASRKITSPNGFKIIFIMRESNSPPETQITEETVDKLKATMSNRYDPADKSLNLSSLYFDQELNKEGIRISLTKFNFMLVVIKIIEEFIPELTTLNMSKNNLYNLETFKGLVEKAPNITKLNIGDNKLKYDKELNKIKGWNLEELNLDGNPFCDNFHDTNKYIRSIRNIFPKLVRLDGNELPPVITFDDEDTSNKALPPTLPSHFVGDQYKTIVSKFVGDYINLYDSSNRQGLLEAYDDQVLFSMSCLSSAKLQGQRGTMKEYIRESRNIQRITESSHREKLLKAGRLNVVATLNDLPPTQHDTASFVVDVSVATPQLVSFTLHGVFRERESKFEPQPIKSFSRMFNLIPKGSGVVIVNEELSLQFATQEQIQNSFKSPAPTPSSSPVQAVPSAELHLQMAQQFSAASGMNLEYSNQCLAQNDWDYEKAGKIFMELKDKGSIPAEAFVK